MSECKHENIRKIVRITADVPYSCSNLSKKAIRSKDIVILAVDWEPVTVWCADCGQQIPPGTIFDDIIQNINDYEKPYTDTIHKIYLIKGVRRCLGSSLVAAKRFVELVYEDNGYSTKPAESYKHLTRIQTENLMKLLETFTA